MVEFTEFVGAVMRQWIVLWSGPLVSMTIAMWQWASKKEIVPKWLLWGLAIISVLLAFFFAWQEKRTEAVNLNKELQDTRIALDALKKPLLVGQINQTVTGDAPELKASQIFILMSVKNIGAPSIVEGWGLNIKSESLSLQAVHPTEIREGLALRDPDGKPLAVFHKTDAIYEKTVKPIERGGMVRGWLLFTLEGIASREIRKPGTTITVFFQDVLDTTYEASLKDGVIGPPMYLPGAEQPFGFNH